MSMRSVVPAAGLVFAFGLMGCQETAESPASSPVTTEVPATDSASGPVRPVDENVPQELVSDAAADMGIVETEMCAVRVNEFLPSREPSEIVDRTSVVLHGWLGDEESMAYPEDPFLYLLTADSASRAWGVPLPMPTPRGDVARKYGVETMRSTGFRITSNLSALPAGDYRVVVGFSKNGEEYRCDRNRVIRLK